MNRADLQRLSTARIREAKVLFGAGEYSGAYYLAGYAVECVLKACFAKGINRYDFPGKASQKVLTHDFAVLVNHAKLNEELAREKRANLRFAASWELVSKWTEESRYSLWMRDDAEAILDAIVKRRDGVLPWIKQRW